MFVLVVVVRKELSGGYWVGVSFFNPNVPIFPTLSDIKDATTCVAKVVFPFP